MNFGEMGEFEKRGLIAVDACSYDSEKDTITVYLDVKLRKPTLSDKILGYLTGVIPAAMLARVVRRMTGKKGTPLEKTLMDFYYDGCKVLLEKKCK